MSELAPVVATPDVNEEMLHAVGQGMGLAADLSRADAVLYRLEGEKARIIAQARPHSVPAMWREDILGSIAQLDPGGPGATAIRRRRPVRTTRELAQGNLARTVYPVINPSGEPIGLLAFDRTLIQEERQRHRKPTFKYAIRLLQEMAAKGQIPGAERVAPFLENDGILVVDRGLEVQYVSGVASSVFNRGGFMYALDGVNLKELPTKDAALAEQAMSERRCVEEAEERPDGHYWVKKAIPLIGYRPPVRTWRRWMQSGGPGPRVIGALITVHDETEERRQERELKLKTQMLLELQHRVRNSLQTITALMRMQARRAEMPETKAALEEAVNRIIHVAAVHEFLFDPNERRVNLRALTERLVELSKPLVPPPLQIEFHVDGRDVFIAGERATPAALVTSELILNAVEHAFTHQTQGNIWVRVGQEGSRALIEVRDDGSGAPDGFRPDMGLSLVNTLTREGLRGEFTITNLPEGGAVARVLFSPQPTQRNGAG